MARVSAPSTITSPWRSTVCEEKGSALQQLDDSRMRRKYMGRGLGDAVSQFHARDPLRGAVEVDESPASVDTITGSARSSTTLSRARGIIAKELIAEERHGDQKTREPQQTRRQGCSLAMGTSRRHRSSCLPGEAAERAREARAGGDGSGRSVAGPSRGGRATARVRAGHEREQQPPVPGPVIGVKNRERRDFALDVREAAEQVCGIPEGHDNGQEGDAQRTAVIGRGTGRMPTCLRTISHQQTAMAGTPRNCRIRQKDLGPTSTAMISKA